MDIQVLNIRHISTDWYSDDTYVYIGRAGNGQSGYFGNPIIKANSEDPGSTLKRYEQYLISRLNEDSDFARKVKDLKGKKLVCFCAPQGGFSPQDKEICHGQVLARYSNQLNEKVNNNE